jgi:hypothetical protein
MWTPVLVFWGDNVAFLTKLKLLGVSLLYTKTKFNPTDFSL